MYTLKALRGSVICDVMQKWMDFLQCILKVEIKLDGARKIYIEFYMPNIFLYP